MKRQTVLSAITAIAFLIPSTAAAQQIVAPTSATINSGGPGFGSIVDTFNQNGLSSNYVSGVTNFDTYLATNPTHSLVFAGNEWFSNSNTTSASVTYNFGAILGIDALALWNEEVSGIGSLNLFWSADGTLFNALGVFSPTDNPAGDYGADIFTFGAVNAQFIRFDMSGCPQQNPGSFPACAIGEVAFRTAQVGAIPEPGTWAMMLLGFGAIGAAMRRRRQSGAMAQVA